MHIREGFWHALKRQRCMQVYISVASFSCAQAEGGGCGCKNSMMDNVGGNLCIYQPEPGKKIPTSRLSSVASFACEHSQILLLSCSPVPCSRDCFVDCAESTVESMTLVGLFWLELVNVHAAPRASRGHPSLAASISSRATVLPASQVAT